MDLTCSKNLEFRDLQIDPGTCSNLGQSLMAEDRPKEALPLLLEVLRNIGDYKIHSIYGFISHCYRLLEHDLAVEYGQRAIDTTSEIHTAPDRILAT